MTQEKPFYAAHWADKNKFRWSFDEVAGMVGPGWRKILKDLTDKLFHLGWDGGILQVKEKFGTLRFYSGGTFPSEIAADIAFDVISQAEGRSGQVCEDCGDYGKVRENGWLRCLCLYCADKYDYPVSEWEQKYMKEHPKTSPTGLV